MLILALDSATPVAGVALWEDGKLLREDFVNYKKTHSETLMPVVDQVLRGCDKKVGELSAIGVTIGPGSFTGLRIGLAAVKGIAMATGVPVVGLSTLEVMAHNFSYTDALICPLLDARKQEVYTGVFDVSQGKPRRFGQEMACTPAEFASNALHIAATEGRERLILLGDGYNPYRDYFQETIGNKALIAPSHLMLPRAAAVADLAAHRVKDADFCETMGLRPVYLRLSEAEYRLGKGEL